MDNQIVSAGGIIMFEKGHKTWNTGLTKETDERVRKNAENISKAVMGKKNHMWKGDKVKMGALHAWVRRNKPIVELCEQCNKRKSFDIANISGKYLRDINDFEWICRKCHMKGDGRNISVLSNLKQFRRKN